MFKKLLVASLLVAAIFCAGGSFNYADPAGDWGEINATCDGE